VKPIRASRSITATARLGDGRSGYLRNARVRFPITHCHHPGLKFPAHRWVSRWLTPFGHGPLLPIHPLAQGGRVCTLRYVLGPASPTSGSGPGQPALAVLLDVARGLSLGWRQHIRSREPQGRYGAPVTTVESRFQAESIGGKLNTNYQLPLFTIIGLA
jgi:hypothetical protein